MQTFVLIAQATTVLNTNQPEQAAQNVASGSTIILSVLLILSFSLCIYLLYTKNKLVKELVSVPEIPEEFSAARALTTHTSVNAAIRTSMNVPTPDEQTLELERLRKESNDLNNQMTALAEENERLKDTFQTLTDENKSLVQDRDSIHNLLLASEEIKQKMAEDIEQMKKQIASLSETNRNLEKDCKAMKESQDEADEICRSTTDSLEALCGGEACLDAFEWQIPEQIPERLSVLAFARFLLSVKLENADRMNVFRELDEALFRLLGSNPASLSLIREKIRKTVNESMAPEFEILWPAQEVGVPPVSSAVIRDLRSNA